MLLPVPWEATVSYGVGASYGPEIIRKAGEQLDVYDLNWGEPHRRGIHIRPTPLELFEKSREIQRLAHQILETPSAAITKQVNEACIEMNTWVYQKSKELLDGGRFVGLIGGDHSVPFGYIQALSEKYSGEFGILHIDAHADLRKAYQGFTFSHASIMHNIISLERGPQKIVQLGIRDFCKEEAEFIHTTDQVVTFFDHRCRERLFQGESWEAICDEIVTELPERVYVSFDIDGMDPSLCPHTGTPVPGGLEYGQAMYLIEKVVSSKKKIIGFDLVETASTAALSNEWDGNVAARLLLKLCYGLLISQKGEIK